MQLTRLLSITIGTSQNEVKPNYDLAAKFSPKNIFLYLKNLALTYVQFNLITNIRNNLFDHFNNLSISFFDKNKSGELTSILVNDVSNMRIALGTSFHKIFIEPINIITFKAN